MRPGGVSLAMRGGVKLAPVLALALSLACGGDDDPSRPDGGSNPLPEPGTPILERTSLATHECQVLNEPDEVAGNTLGSAIAPVGETSLVARASFGPTGNGDEYAFILAVAPASFSPMGLGDEAYRTTALELMRLPALTAAGDGALLAWVAGDQGARIMLAALDAAGDVVDPAAPIAETGAAFGVVALALASAGSTVRILWADSSLHVQLAGVDGALRGDAVTVRTAPMTGAALAPAGEDGTAVVWTESQEDAGVYLALLDGDGAVTAGPLNVSGGLPELTFVDAPAVIAAGDDLLVAWSEHYLDEDQDGDPGTWDPEGNAVIRVARVAADAQRVLALERLQAPEKEIIHIQPAFAAIDDGAVALSWSRGTIIYVCGGCVSDNKRRLVLIEPRDLVPLGDVVEMEGETGFSTAAMIRSAGDLVHLLGLDYHAISNVALARTHCAPR
jgi:hypothetical protein